jgi:hypothetical protein
VAVPNLGRKDVSSMTSGWEDAFAEENNRIRERIPTSSFESIREALHELGFKTAAGIDDTQGQLEVSRRVAKWILYAAIEMGRSFEECESFLEDVVSLGFERPQDRVTTVAVLARHYLAVGRRAEGYRHFLPAMTELENTPGVIASAPPELLEGYRRLLAQLASP